MNLEKLQINGERFHHGIPNWKTMLLFVKYKKEVIYYSKQTPK